MLYGVFIPITALIVELHYLSFVEYMIRAENVIWCKNDIITVGCICSFYLEMSKLIRIFVKKLHIHLVIKS
jgi:hypothetical protein